MIDSHCHLADEVFEADLDAVVLRARGTGVSGALCILAAENAAEAVRAARVAALWPEVRFAAGIHPHQAHVFAGRPTEAVATVRAALHTLPAARAIGEIGLDYHYDFSPRDVQREIFRAQLSLAREVDRPVVIHTREADEDTFAILKDAGVAGVFHCFTGDADLARRALDLGFHLSFAGILTFPRADSLRRAAAMVPADRLLAETDCPFLAPVPFRGKRNEPARVARVIAALAELRGVPVEAVRSETTANFTRLFRP